MCEVALLKRNLPEIKTSSQFFFLAEYLLEAHLEPNRRSMMELFCENTKKKLEQVNCGWVVITQPIIQYDIFP